ncbi:MAG: RNA polymerase factor sigma-54 [Anaerolineae bacterium]
MTMRMGMDYGQHMEMRPSPSLIAFTEILQLSGMELQQAIMQAVAENPALEMTETELCPACGDPLLSDGTCLRCSRGESPVDVAERSVLEHEEEERDLFARVADQMTLEEHLLAELAAALDEEDLPIAEFLVGELDDRGFLDMPLATVAASLGVPLERVEHVLRVLQSVGPLGVGARTVEECLGLQLDRWAESGVENPIARRLIEEHLGDLGQGKYSQLARQLGVEYDDVVEARDFIRAHLRPYPIADATDSELWESHSGPGFIAPDVIARLADDEIEVDILESRRYALSISPLYREYASSIAEGRDIADGERLTAEDRKHIASQVGSARQFLTHIRERRETMRRVSAYVMARQQDYLRQGPRHLRPLTRAEVAEALDLHESTVSRATAGKYVLLPNRHVVPFSSFFKAALSVQDVMREMVENETRPLTDSELAEMLTERGYKVARRTVAKYRNQMGILPSSLR